MPIRSLGMIWRFPKAQEISHLYRTSAYRIFAAAIDTSQLLFMFDATKKAAGIHNWGGTVLPWNPGIGYHIVFLAA